MMDAWRYLSQTAANAKGPSYSAHLTILGTRQTYWLHGKRFHYGVKPYYIIDERHRTRYTLVCSRRGKSCRTRLHSKINSQVFQECNKVEVFMCPFCYEGNKVGACALRIICQVVYMIVETEIQDIGLRNKPENLQRALIEKFDIGALRSTAAEGLKNLSIGSSPSFDFYPFNSELLRGITDY